MQSVVVFLTVLDLTALPKPVGAFHNFTLNMLIVVFCDKSHIKVFILYLHVRLEPFGARNHVNITLRPAATLKLGSMAQGI